MSDAAASESNLRARATYRYWTRASLRFSDEDRMGHINNAVYLTWLETCRVDYLYSLFEPSEFLDVVLARIEVDYLKETRYPGEVDIGGVITRLGNKSVTSVYGIFRDDECLATSLAVNVFFDPATRRAMTPTPALRSAILAEIDRPDD